MVIHLDVLRPSDNHTDTSGSGTARHHRVGRVCGLESVGTVWGLGYVSLRGFRDLVVVRHHLLDCHLGGPY